VIFLVAMAAVWPIALIVVSVVHGLNPIYRQLTFALGAPVGDDADSASALNSGGCAPGAGHRLGYYRPAEILKVSSGLRDEILKTHDA
jgi:hypothetical protein